jgi:hypothetical protein
LLEIVLAFNDEVKVIPVLKRFELIVLNEPLDKSIDGILRLEIVKVEKTPLLL